MDTSCYLDLCIKKKNIPKSNNSFVRADKSQDNVPNDFFTVADDDQEDPNYFLHFTSVHFRVKWTERCDIYLIKNSPRNNSQCIIIVIKSLSKCKRHLSLGKAFPARMHPASSVDSDQPAHSYSLIKVFKGYSVGSQWSKCGQWRLWLACANTQADLSSLGAHAILLEMLCPGLFHNTNGITQKQHWAHSLHTIF